MKQSQYVMPAKPAELPKQVFYSINKEISCKDAASPGLNLHNTMTYRKTPTGRIALRLLLVFSLSLPLILPAGCARREVRSISRSGYVLPVDAASAKTALQQFYHNWRDVPHKVGGMSPSAVDCSGLVAIAYSDIFGMKLPRTVEEQAGYGRNITRDALQPGDLLFFRTGIFQDHVGIFVDQNRFIHASSSKGVMISRLDEPYWRNRFVKAARLYDYRRTASR